VVSAWKGFREGNVISLLTISQNPVTQKRTFFEISLDAFANLLSYNAIFLAEDLFLCRGMYYFEPGSQEDITDFSFLYAYAGISSDYRKRLPSILLYAKQFYWSFCSEGYKSAQTLRYRFSDQFTLRSINGLIMILTTSESLIIQILKLSFTDFVILHTYDKYPVRLNIFLKWYGLNI